MLAVFVASLSFVWIAVLIQPLNLFDWFPGIVERYIRSEKWQRPFIHCEKCLAGQISLWWGLYLWGADMINGFQWACLVVFSIMFAAFIGAIYQKLLR